MSDPLRDIEIGSGGGGDAADKRVTYWQKELENAGKREKKYRKDAERTVRIYEGDARPENSFNVLFSNTETLLPACYNQLPRPYVDRRFQDADPNGKHAAQCMERTLSALEDSGDAEYQPFTQLMELAVLGALVPGRGVTWFKYDAKFQEEPSEEPAELPDDADDTATTAAREVEGEKVLEVPQEKVAYETICGEDVDYDAFLFGSARQWVNVPWVARSHQMTEADATASFGKQTAAKLKYQTPQKQSGEWKKDSDQENEPQGTENVALVWEIWNKEKKEVIFYSPTYKDALLKVVPDPYQLSGFFPCPQPLHFLLKRSKLTPTPLYMLYEEQAKELNRITARINKILGALKVRGFYDGTMQGLKLLLEADDNTLIPAENVAALQQGQNLQNSIWFMPFDVLVAALQALWQGREELKDTIYEITGMADIMRGEGAASAPATLQQIKNQWGTLRLKRWQRYVQEYVRSCLRIMGELASQHFSIETFAQITNLDFAKPEEVQQAQMTLQQINQQMLQMQQQAAMQAAMQPPQGPPGVPGAGGPLPPQPGASPPAPPGPPAGPAAPPPPPQPPPEMQQAMQQAQAVLAKPQWTDVVGLLKNNLQRYYRIDIETNSTIATDTKEDKDNINEAITALGQMFQGFMPLVQQGALTMPAVKSMILTVVRKFNFGREVEDAIASMPDQLPPPPPPPGTPTPEEQEAAKQEANVKIQTAQAKLQALSLEGQRAQQEDQLAQQDNAAKMAKAQRDEELARQQHQVKMAQLGLQMLEIQLKTQVAHTNALAATTQANIKSRTAQQAADTASTVAAATVETSQVKADAAKKQAKMAAQKPKNGGGH